MRIISITTDAEKHFKANPQGKDPLHMSDAVKRKCNSLIKSLCANYYGGNCLRLDDGNCVPCPQINSNSLICKYFRDAVLGADKALYTQVMSDDGVKTCSVCGRLFRAVSNRAKYCERCSKKQAKKRKAEWARKNRISA